MKNKLIYIILSLSILMICSCDEEPAGPDIVDKNVEETDLVFRQGSGNATIFGTVINKWLL